MVVTRASSESTLSTDLDASVQRQPSAMDCIGSHDGARHHPGLPTFFHSHGVIMAALARRSQESTREAKSTLNRHSPASQKGT